MNLYNIFVISVTVMRTESLCAECYSHSEILNPAQGVVIEFCLGDNLQEASNYNQHHEEKCELICDGGVGLPESVSDLERLGIGMMEYTSKYICRYQEGSSDEHGLK